MSPEEAAYSYYVFLEPLYGKKVTLENNTTVVLDIRDSDLRLKDVCFLTYRFFEQEIPGGFKSFIDLELKLYDMDREMTIMDTENYYFYLYHPGNVLVGYL